MFRELTAATAFLLTIAGMVRANQLGVVKEMNYEVLRNMSTGPIVCAMDQPEVVYTGLRSRVHCSAKCGKSDNCTSFNFKDVSSGQGLDFSCEHFGSYPFNFTVDAACRHYAVKGERPTGCYQSGVDRGMAPDHVPRISAENCHYPFTFDGMLYHGCVKNVLNVENVTAACEPWGCFALNYTGAVCAANIDYEAENTTESVAIPTQGSVPMMSVFGWIIFQQRDVDTGFNWNLTWVEYKNGFGDIVTDDFWLGLERLHFLTTSGNYRLRFEWQEAGTDLWFSIEYWLFYIEDEVAAYTLHVGGYVDGDDGRAVVSDTVYDLLGYVHPLMSVAHHGMQFSTADVDNDPMGAVNCGFSYGGGWWFTKCSLICPTLNSPMWFGLGDAAFHTMQKSRMMLKPQ